MASSPRHRFEVRETVFARTGVASYNWPEAARYLLETSVVDKGTIDDIVRRIVNLIERQADPR